MRCMTLWQPWASLVAEGIKTVETRGRAHPWRRAVGERIAIHAAARWPKCPACNGRAMIADGQFCGDCDGSGHHYLVAEVANEMPLGALLATCVLLDVVPILAGTDALAAEEPRPCVVDWRSTLTYYGEPNLGEGVEIDAQRPFGDFTPGRYALILDNLFPLPNPIPAKGKQGLWKTP